VKVVEAPVPTASFWVLNIFFGFGPGLSGLSGGGRRDGQPSTDCYSLHYMKAPACLTADAQYAQSIEADGTTSCR